MNTMSLVVLAAGDSLRFINDKNYLDKRVATRKQWLDIDGVFLWLKVATELCRYMRSKGRTFLKTQELIIVASKKDLNYINKILPSELFGIKCRAVCGGSSRGMSLYHALRCIESRYVLVTDCARGVVVDEVLDSIFSQFGMLQKGMFSCIVPFLSVVDTVLLHSNNEINYINRDDLKLIQTPQLSKTKSLKKAFNCYLAKEQKCDLYQDIDEADEEEINKDICEDKQKLLSQDSLDFSLVDTFSDESSLMHSLGYKIGFAKGSSLLNKITYKSDLTKELLKPKSSQAFIGLGSDVHELIKSELPLKLCGVEIKSEFSLKAHSDGDVAIHALIDSMLGAIGLGDIGELYPDTDMSLKGISSTLMLKEVYEYILSVGFELVNIDLTLLAQAPKITPYKSKMQEELSKILYLPKQRVNIKASTTERLGFIGREEGILVHAISNLKRRDIV